MGEVKQIIKQIEFEHGIINIVPPKRKATQKDIEDTYKMLAELIIKYYSHIVKAI